MVIARPELLSADAGEPGDDSFEAVVHFALSALGGG